MMPLRQVLNNQGVLANVHYTWNRIELACIVEKFPKLSEDLEGFIDKLKELVPIFKMTRADVLDLWGALKPKVGKTISDAMVMKNNCPAHSGRKHTMVNSQRFCKKGQRNESMFFCFCSPLCLY